MNASAGSPVDGQKDNEKYSPLFGDMDKVFKDNIDIYTAAAEKHRAPHYLTRRFAILGIVYAIVATSLLALMSIDSISSNDFFMFFFLLCWISGTYLIGSGGIISVIPVIIHWTLQVSIIKHGSHLVELELIYALALTPLCWLSNIKFGYTRGWSRNRSMAKKLKNLYSLYKCNAYEEIDIRQMLIQLVNDNIDQNHNDIVNDYALFGDKLTSLAKIRK